MNEELQRIRDEYPSLIVPGPDDHKQAVELKLKTHKYTTDVLKSEKFQNSQAKIIFDFLLKNLPSGVFCKLIPLFINHKERSKL